MCNVIIDIFNPTLFAVRIYSVNCTCIQPHYHPTTPTYTPLPSLHCRFSLQPPISPYKSYTYRVMFASILTLHSHYATNFPLTRYLTLQKCAIRAPAILISRYTRAASVQSTCYFPRRASRLVSCAASASSLCKCKEDLTHTNWLTIVAPRCTKHGTDTSETQA